MCSSLRLLASSISLVALSTAATAQGTAAVFEHDIVPAFRGSASARFAGWDAFAVPFGGSNPADDAATDVTAALAQLTPGAIITSTLNIYSPGAAPLFILEVDPNAAVAEVVLQVRGLGNRFDPASFFLTYEQQGSSASVGADTFQVLNPVPGFAQETFFRFDLTVIDDDVAAFGIRFMGEESNISLDALMLDVRLDESIGATYCTANPNSTGAIGVLSVFGSDLISANSVELRSASLPPGAFGLYLTSRVQGSVAMPGGSAGVLCLGGQVGRFVAQSFSASAAGEHRAAIDLTQLPTPTGPVAAVSGETWNFQCWHRDLGPTPTSNFTSPVSILFQ